MVTREKEGLQNGGNKRKWDCRIMLQAGMKVLERLGDEG